MGFPPRRAHRSSCTPTPAVMRAPDPRAPLALDEPSAGNGSNQSDRRARCGETKSVAQDHPQHPKPLRAKRHANAGFARALRHRVADDAVKAKRGGEQSGNGEKPNEMQGESPGRERSHHRLFHAHKLIDGDARIGIMHSFANRGRELIHIAACSGDNLPCDKPALVERHVIRSFAVIRKQTGVQYVFDNSDNPSLSGPLHKLADRIFRTVSSEPRELSYRLSW